MIGSVLAVLIAAQIPNGAIQVPAGQPAYTATMNHRGRLSIRLSRPVDHLMGARFKMGNGVRSIVFDRGVFSDWLIKGTTGRDVVRFASQGTIINRRRGGTFDMGADRVRDRFIFQNQINVAACSEKHGYPCHPLNHLQQVTIRNFGPEDEVILQGRVYAYRDMRGGGFPGVPIQRLRVVPLP